MEISGSRRKREHITTSFFFEELSRVAGEGTGYTWLISNRQCIQPCTIRAQNPSAQVCESEIDCRHSRKSSSCSNSSFDVSQSPELRPQISQNAKEFDELTIQDCSASNEPRYEMFNSNSNDNTLPESSINAIKDHDLFGLLFTDAAHLFMDPVHKK